AVSAAIAINTAPIPGKTFSIATDKGALAAANSAGEAAETTPYPVATYKITTVTSAETWAKGKFLRGFLASSPKVNTASTCICPKAINAVAANTPVQPPGKKLLC